MNGYDGKLIDERGQVTPGVLPQAVAEVNYLDYDLRNVMDRRRSRLARRWRFNQFQFIGVMARDWVFGAAVADLKLIANGFFYLYDFTSGALLEHSSLQPLARGTHIEPRPEDGAAHYRKGGVDMRILADGHSRQLTITAPGDIRILLDLQQDEDPLRLVSRAGYNGWAFTRKSAGLPVDGEVRWGDRVWRCDEQCRGSIGWSCGFMRRETAWNWACLAGRLGDGRSLGLNLAAGVNETGVTENALWLDGRCIRLGLADFRFDRYRPETPWRVTTSDGRVDLHFVPAGVRRERLNALVLASNFRQFAGTFEGVVVDDQGRELAVTGLRGLMEDHYARW